MTTVALVGGPSPQASRIAGQASAAPAETATAPDPAQDTFVNPQVQVDPSNGVVLLQFRDDAGKLVRQVPSEYELRSYQLNSGPPNSVQANPGQANPVQANPGQANPVQANPGQANPGQANPGQANPDPA